MKIVKSLPLWLLLLSVKAFAAYTVTTTKSGGTTVDGYWNLDNQVVITMTHDNNEGIYWR